MADILIIALDFPTSKEALNFVEQLSPKDCILKVGLQLYVAAGPSLIKQIISRGFKVFLDLKFHDIPNTVAGACKSAAELGVWMINVHAAGGSAMLQAAVESLKTFDNPPLLIGVTVLTSMDDTQLESSGVKRSANLQVKHLASLAANCGLDGVVCSAMEAEMLRREQGSDFILVTPGIRPAGSDAGDQQRIMTPVQAKRNGASYLVIGRPVTEAADPLSVIRSINQSLN